MYFVLNYICEFDDGGDIRSLQRKLSNYVNNSDNNSYLRSLHRDTVTVSVELIIVVCHLYGDTVTISIDLTTVTCHLYRETL